MDREYVESWLNTLREAWLNKDSIKAASLFTNTTFYQETPFLTPYTKYEKIKKEWTNIDNQDIKKLEFKILAVDNNTVIVNWIFQRDVIEFDGIYEIKFNDNNECIYFKSWEMEK